MDNYYNLGSNYFILDYCIDMQVKLEQNTLEVSDKESRLPHLIDALMTLADQGFQVFDVRIDNYLTSRQGEEPNIVFTSQPDGV